MNLRPRRREEPEINLVPMIDVVLVLLIFFMIATSLHHQSELEVRLPEASGKPLPSAVAQLQVDVDANGHYAVNGRKLDNIDSTALKDALLTAAEGRSLPLAISADGRTPHQSVVTVLDVAGQLGIKQLSIATTNASGSPGVAPAVGPSAPNP